MINIVNLYKQWLDIETDITYTLVDLLSHEYGWSIEYVQELTLPEISILLRKIKQRHKNEDIISQVNTAKGMSGKISANDYGKPKPKEVPKEIELKNLQQLAKTLKLQVKKVK